METKAIIFDGSNAAHRLSSVLGPLNNARGERVEVLYGLLRLLSAVMRANPAEQCYVVWDGKNSKKIRQNIDPLYKHRRETDKDDSTKERIKGMHLQVERCWELFGQFLPIHWLVSEKYEADDIMAMLAHEANAKSETALIVSGDKDLLQLVTENVRVYSPNGDKYCTHENFSTYTKGFPTPQAFLAGKCLMGDQSDNVPGVGGVGEKTALKILEKHNWGLTGLLNSPSEELKSTKVGQVIISPSGVARIKLNYKLMSLQGNTHLQGTHEHIRANQIEVRKGTRINSRELRTNMARMQFASLMTSFPQFIAPFQELEI